MAAAVQEAKHRGEDAIPKQLSDKSRHLSNSRRSPHKPLRSAHIKRPAKSKEELCQTTVARRLEFGDENLVVPPQENSESPPLSPSAPQFPAHGINLGKRSHESSSDGAVVGADTEAGGSGTRDTLCFANDCREIGEPLKKSPKLVESRETNKSQSDPSVQTDACVQIGEHGPVKTDGEEKGNIAFLEELKQSAETAKPHLAPATTAAKPPKPRNAISTGASSGKGPRIGIRRL